MDQVGQRRDERIGSCPHIDRDDVRCSTRFNLGRIEQAFSVCFGSYHGCPMYHRINNEDTLADVATPALVTVTISCHGAEQPLRPTGT